MAIPNDPAFDVRLLLDTHIAPWAVASSNRLSSEARRLIADPQNTIYVSAVSIWEIAIKHPAGKGVSLPFGALDAIAFFKQAGYLLLDVSARHAARTETPEPLHKDPFDRLLVAQALTEPLHLLTHDRNVAAYGANILLV